MFRSVGELMALSGQISAFGEELTQELRCSGSEMAQKMQAGYEETREKFAAGSEEFARKLRESQAETKEKFLATGEELAPEDAGESGRIPGALGLLLPDAGPLPLRCRPGSRAPPAFPFSEKIRKSP